MNHVVRKMDSETGIVSTVAGTGKEGFSGDGGDGAQAMLNQPHSIQFDTAGELLYICDIKNHRIRVLEISTGKIDTFCGNGKPGATEDGAKAGKDTPLNGPRALDISPVGDLWLATREGNQVFRIDMEAKRLHHVAGTGAKGFSGNGGPAKDATPSGPKAWPFPRTGNGSTSPIPSRTPSAPSIPRKKLQPSNSSPATEKKATAQIRPILSSAA